MKLSCTIRKGGVCNPCQHLRLLIGMSVIYRYVYSLLYTGMCISLLYTGMCISVLACFPTFWPTLYYSTTEKITYKWCYRPNVYICSKLNNWVQLFFFFCPDDRHIDSRTLRNEAMFYFELYCTLGYKSITSKHSLNFLPLYDYSQLIGVLTNGVRKVNSKCKIEFLKVTVNLSNLCIRCWNLFVCLCRKNQC